MLDEVVSDEVIDDLDVFLLFLYQELLFFFLGLMDGLPEPSFLYCDL